MERATHDGLIYIDITIPDFQIEAAVRIGANPRFVVDSCPKVGTREVRYCTKDHPKNVKILN